MANFYLKRSRSIKIGYARVSTRDQNSDLQNRHFEKSRLHRHLYMEQITGATQEHPKPQNLLAQILPVDPEAATAIILAIL